MDGFLSFGGEKSARLRILKSKMGPLDFHLLFNFVAGMWLSKQQSTLKLTESAPTTYVAISYKLLLQSHLERNFNIT